MTALFATSAIFPVASTPILEDASTDACPSIFATSLLLSVRVLPLDLYHQLQFVILP